MRCDAFFHRRRSAPVTAIQPFEHTLGVSRGGHFYAFEENCLVFRKNKLSRNRYFVKTSRKGNIRFLPSCQRRWRKMLRTPEQQLFGHTIKFSYDPKTTDNSSQRSLRQSPSFFSPASKFPTDSTIPIGRPHLKQVNTDVTLQPTFHNWITEIKKFYYVGIFRFDLPM